MSFDISVFASFVLCLPSIFVYLIKICYSFVVFFVHMHAYGTNDSVIHSRFK